MSKALQIAKMGAPIGGTPIGVVLTTAAEATVYTVFDVTATFDRSVNGLEDGDLTLVNCTASVAGSGATYTITVTPTAEGTVSVTIPQGAVVGGNRASNTISVTYYAGYRATSFNGALEDWWTSAATWSTSGGNAINTPTTGDETATDGGLEAWTSPTNLTSWAELIAGTSTVNQETTVVHGGSNSCRLDVDASNSAAQVNQSVGQAVGEWRINRVWAQANANDKSIRLDCGGNTPTQVIPNGSWLQVISVVRCKTTGVFGLSRNLGTSSSIYVDDASSKVLSVPTLGLLHSAPLINAEYSVAYTRPTHYCVGEFLVYQDVDNYVLLYSDGEGKIFLIQRLSGTTTEIGSWTVTYVAAATLTATIHDNNQVDIVYNGASVATNQAIDAGWASGTNYTGPFSTDAVITVHSWLYDGL